MLSILKSFSRIFSDDPFTLKDVVLDSINLATSFPIEPPPTRIILLACSGFFPNIDNALSAISLGQTRYAKSPSTKLSFNLGVKICPSLLRPTITVFKSGKSSVSELISVFYIGQSLSTLIPKNLN